MSSHTRSLLLSVIFMYGRLDVTSMHLTPNRSVNEEDNNVLFHIFPCMKFLTKG